MAQPSSIEQPFPSTQWAWKREKIAPGAAGTSRARRSRSGFLRLPRLPRDRGVTLSIVYRGGAESWWLIKARGEHQVFPGHLALEDVMVRVFSEG